MYSERTRHAFSAAADTAVEVCDARPNVPFGTGRQQAMHKELQPGSKKNLTANEISFAVIEKILIVVLENKKQIPAVKYLRGIIKTLNG